MSELIKALLDFHAEVPTIDKKAKAQYGKYADLETVLSAVTPVLCRHGLIITQGFEPVAESFEPILVTKLIHSSGEEMISRLPMVIAKGRNPLHDWGASCTYQRRYALLSILGLCADMDNDGNYEAAEPVQAQPVTTRPASKIIAKTPAPAASSECKILSPLDEPLTEEEKALLQGLIKELAPDKRNVFLEQFRSEFGLKPQSKVAYAITKKSHEKFIQEVMPSFT